MLRDRSRGTGPSGGAATAAARRGRWYVAAALATVGVVVAWLVRSLADGEDAPPAPDSAVARKESGPEPTRPPRRRARGAHEPGPAEASSEPAVGEPEDGETPGSRRVRVVDGDGVPVAGLVVEWSAGTSRGSMPTDGFGRAVVPAPETTDGAPPAVVAVSVFDGTAERRVELAAADTEVVVEGLPLVEIVVVDGATLEPVAARGATLTTWIGNDAREVDLGPGRFSSRRLPLGPGRRVDLRVEVDPPDGYGALRGWACDTAVAPGVRAARVVVPVFRATTRTLSAVDAGGLPAPGARVDRVRLVRSESDELSTVGAGVTWSDAAEGDSGRIVVTGMPAAPWNAVALDVRSGEPDRGPVRWGALVARLDVRSPSLHVELSSVRRDEDERRRRTPAATSVGGRSVSRAEWWSKRTEGERSPLDVRVLRRDGTPAAGAFVWIRPTSSGAYFDDRRLEDAVTDADGRVRFASVPRERIDVAAWGPGFVATVATADVRAASEAVIREPAPRAVQVLVVDRDGRPVPCVRVTARSALVSAIARDAGSTAASQVRDGVDHLTPRTAAGGTSDLVVPPGPVRYTAALAASAATVETEDSLVRIELPAAE